MVGWIVVPVGFLLFGAVIVGAEIGRAHFAKDAFPHDEEEVVEAKRGKAGRRRSEFDDCSELE